jgi:photosystem II stability/assembly factor-like uncharacterized protein
MVQLNEGSSPLLVRVLLGFLLGLAIIAAVQAQDWQRLGPPGGMVLTLGIDASGAVYLGTADGHVFVKDNSGRPWELRGRIGNRTDAVVSRLVTDIKSGIVYAAIWYQQPGAGGGVFRSDDGARTWKLLGLPNEAVRALEITSSPTRVILAGTRTGVFRSTDKGNIWERITPVDDPELRNVDSLAVDPRDPNIIYTGTYHLPWKTTDGGKTWKSVTAGLIDDSDIMSLRVDATNPERVFLSACSGIYRSENQGGQWSKLQGIPYAARRTQAIVQDPQNPQTLYAGTTEGLWITRDAGETWERTTPKDWVVNTVAVLPDSQSKESVLVGTESRGVQVSEDAGKTFVEYNDGFTHQVVSQLIGDPADGSHQLMLMERSGSLLWESHDAGETWTPATLMKAEDSSKTHFPAESMQRLYASPWGWMVRGSSPEQIWILEKGTEKWREWKVRLPISSTSPPHSSTKAHRQSPPTRTVRFVLPTGSEIEFSEHDAYVPSKDGLLRCTLAGNCVWLKAFGRGGVFHALQISPDGSTLCVVLDGKLGISSDGGQTATWSDLPVSSNNILWIRRLNGDAAQTLFLGSADGLFTSTDGGASWNRRERGLPAGQVEQVVQGHGFVAASLREGGMYVSTDGGKTWDRTYPDAERSRFTGIVETSPGVLTIGSQSEGVLRWQVKANNE